MSECKPLLWGLGDVTPENFPHTYWTIQRGLAHHAKTGANTFSMVAGAYTRSLQSST